MNRSETGAIAVIGGGVSGLAAAHYLLKKGYRVDLFESSERLGGRIAIDSLNGEEICFGGKNIGYEYSEFRAFLEHYGLPSYEYFGINSARLMKGRPQIFNSRKKLRSLLTLAKAAKPSDLIKLKQAIHAIKSNRLNGDLGGPYFEALFKETGQNFSDHFSGKFIEGFLRPLTVRMNGAEPHHLSLENLGTHLQMVQDEYEQLDTSLGDILEAFSQTERVRVCCNHSVSELSKLSAPQKGYKFKTITPSGERGLHQYQKIFLALPACAAALLLEPHFGALSHLLKGVRYCPVGVIVADYEQAVFSKAMRALTFGPDYPVSNIGAYGLNDLSRVRYTFSGAASEDVLQDTLDGTHLLNMAEAQAAPYFHLKDNPCRAFKFKYWKKGLCAYTKNEAKFRSNLDAGLRTLPGLYLTGDYRKGASIENCFRASKSAVEDLLNHLPPSQNKITPSQTITRIGNVYV
jgi:oxygen-dependent protoporphyrinogen oxidase